MLKNECDKTQSGQILPMAAVLLSFLIAIIIACNKDLYLMQRKINGSEAEFQKKFTDNMKYAYLLNELTKYNRKMAEILSRLLILFEGGTARGLDLAASTPLWEKKLPIPSPENIYQSLELALPQAKSALKLLREGQNQIQERLPGFLKRHLIRLSTEESLCLLVRDENFQLTQPSRALSPCILTISSGMFSAPHLRKVQPLDQLSRNIGVTTGFLLIEPNEDGRFSDHTMQFADSHDLGLFEDFLMSFTHGSFCSSESQAPWRAQCPKTSLSRHKILQKRQLKKLSFDPNWSVIVETKNK